MDTSFLSLFTWFPFLLENHPRVLLGGFDRGDWYTTLLLRCFWKNFHKCYPEHEFYNIHSEDRWGRSLPFYLHIDEGTGLKKGAVLVLSWQSILGKETSTLFRNYREIEDLEERMTKAQMHNAKGSTYLTRFLFTALPKKSYSGKGNPTYFGILDVLSKECRDLMLHGVSVCGETWYPCCLGMKGDQPALVKCGKFKRSFYNMGFNKGCCWECMAGMEGYPWEEVAPEPQWAGTIGLCEPWNQDEPSPFLQIPSYNNNPHEFWRRDPFHAFKQSIGGHFAASVIVVLAIDFGLWWADGLSSAVDEMLERAFTDFRYWVRHEWRGKVTNYLVGFTKANLHFQDLQKFPYGRFKGSDQMLLLRWLAHVINFGTFMEGDATRRGLSLLMNPPKVEQVPFFQQALKGCEGGINFFHTLHREGLWHSRDTSKHMASECFKFCVAYKSLAVWCHQKRMARFHLEPSLHTMMHFFVDLDKAGEINLSPAASTTEMDEDFIGKICRTCRTIHASATTRRCIDRYLIRCHVEFQNLSQG